MSTLELTLLAICYLGTIGVVVIGHISHRRLRDNAKYELELIQVVRHTMEDLKSRDPQIEEMLDVGLLQLNEWERSARRRSASLVRPWGLKYPR